MKKLIFSILPAALMALVAVPARAQQRGPVTPPAPATTPQPESGAITVEENVVYGGAKGSELHLDIYQPADRGEGSRPAVVLIHGGGWTGFDKSTMRGMGQFLARSGFVALSVDYRLLHGAENRWPAQLDDVQRAVRWIRANAARYGVNPARIGAFGHSAGAQLAALLGMEDTHDNSDPALAGYSSKVQAVVEVDGPTDFTVKQDPDDLAFLTNFFGTEYSKHPEIWQDASPAFHAAKSDAPFLIVHGTEDQAVPIAQAQELYDKLHAARVPVKFLKVDDGHTFQTAAARHELAIETLEFFNRYIGER